MYDLPVVGSVVISSFCVVGKIEDGPSARSRNYNGQNHNLSHNSNFNHILIR